MSNVAAQEVLFNIKWVHSHITQLYLRFSCVILPTHCQKKIPYLYAPNYRLALNILKQASGVTCTQSYIVHLQLQVGLTSGFSEMHKVENATQEASCPLCLWKENNQTSLFWSPPPLQLPRSWAKHSSEKRQVTKTFKFAISLLTLQRFHGPHKKQHQAMNLQGLSNSTLLNK